MFPKQQKLLSKRYTSSTEFTSFDWFSLSDCTTDFHCSVPKELVFGMYCGYFDVMWNQKYVLRQTDSNQRACSISFPPLRPFMRSLPSICKTFSLCLLAWASVIWVGRVGAIKPPGIQYGGEIRK